MSSVTNEEMSEFWSNPVDHFRPNLKALSLYVDYQYHIQNWLQVKERWLSPWYMPWWMPFYQLGTWYSQRTRNLFLVENHLSYRPYKYRRNDEDRKNPY